VVKIQVAVFWVLTPCTVVVKNRDGSTGIATVYGLDNQSSRVRFPVGAGNFSLHHRVQNDSGGPHSLLFNGYRSLGTRWR
jgi:hypothetical protein